MRLDHLELLTFLIINAKPCFNLATYAEVLTFHSLLSRMLSTWPQKTGNTIVSQAYNASMMKTD